MPVVNAVLVKDLLTDRIFPALQPGEVLILRRENVHISYEIGLVEIVNEGFEQPIFGANYLKGDTRSQISDGSSDSWKLKFYSGGCGTLLPVLGNLIQDARSRPTTYPQTIQGQVVINPAQVVGYIDPSDPSIIYVQQPQARPTGLE
jgi:hypothetical protein